MSMEHFLMISTAAIAIASIFYIPKDKYRLAFVSFITNQTITWGTSLIRIQIGILENPVREFPRATRNSFINLFLFLPMVFTWFIVLFPHNAPFIKKITHYFIFISFFVWYGYFGSEYTDLANNLLTSRFLYIIMMYFEFSFYFIISHIYISWLFKKADLPIGG